MEEADRFSAKLGATPFLVTAELVPPKGTNVSAVLSAAHALRPVVDAVNVTDGSGAMMRTSALAISARLLGAGIDPILQVTCRDRNRLALQADLLGAAVLGIRNVLLLTGDDPTAGDHPDAKPVFDLTSAQLMDAARRLSQGQDLSGKPLDGAPVLCVGAAAHPGAEDLELELQKARAKIDSGAQFFQTQAVFAVEPLARFMDRARALRAPVLAGVLLLKSAKMARYMNEHVWGVRVPDRLIARLERYERVEDRKRACVDITAELVRAVREVSGGVHLYSLGWEELVPEVLAAAGLAASAQRTPPSGVERQRPTPGAR